MAEFAGKKFAAIEGGGTSWVAAIAESSFENIVLRQDFKTEDPVSTLGAIRAWLQGKDFDAIGIASFGPIDPVPDSPTYGYITSTPKPGWKMTDVVKLLGLKDEFAHIPFKFETDVNAPAMAEYTRIQSPGITSSAYITVGTGLGVGVVVNNNAVHGLLHPEAGHMLPQRKEGDTFPGVCPFHGACFEGMICSKALAARANCGIEDLPSLPDDHEVWDVFAFYLAQLCANLVYMVSIQRIAIGGGVLNRLSVLPKVRSHMKALMNGYIQVDKVTDLMQLENFVVSPHWGSKTGLIGASYLAYLAIQEQK